jgi:8-oxo-dGTP diphosphatase
MSIKSNYPVPAVRIIVHDNFGRVMLLKRSDNVFKPGSWCLPGGLVDYGETVFDAARRELIEECGLKLISAHFLFYQDSLPEIKGEMHCINFYFKGKYKGEIALNEESSKIAWVFRSDINHYDIAFKNEQGLIRYWNEFC